MTHILLEFKNMDHQLSNALSTMFLRRLVMFLRFKTYMCSKILKKHHLMIFTYTNLASCLKYIVFFVFLYDRLDVHWQTLVTVNTYGLPFSKRQPKYILMLAGGLKTQNNGVYCKIRRASFDVFAMGEKTYPCFRQQQKHAIFSVDNKRMIITFF